MWRRGLDAAAAGDLMDGMDLGHDVSVPKPQARGLDRPSAFGEISQSGRGLAAAKNWRRLFWEAEPPTLENVCVRLAREPRYFGHGRIAWSVAAHSLLVADLAAPEHRLAALTHDLGEAVTKDQPRPLKQMFPALADWCERVQAEMLDALGLPPPTDAARTAVDATDRTAFAAEVIALFPVDRSAAFLDAETQRAGPLDMDAARAARVVTVWPDEAAGRLREEIEKAMRNLEP